MHQAPSFPNVKELVIMTAYVTTRVASDATRSMAKKAKVVAVDAGCFTLGLALSGLFIGPVIGIYVLDWAIKRTDY